VIFPRAGWEVCEERIYRRGLWQHFSHKSRPQVSRYVAHAYQVVTMATDYITRRGWPVIEVDNGDDDPSRAKAELRSKLTTIPTFTREIPALSIAV
jgi:hypothetical protein